MRKLLILFLFYLMVISSINKSKAGERSLYDFSWLDPDKEVYVLQNRKFRKKNHLYVQAGGGITTSGPFVDSYFYQGRVGFFFMEDWGIEFVYNKTENDKNGVAKSVNDEGAVAFTRQVEAYYGGLLVWSPFYSKLNTFNKIFYYDISFGIGAAKLDDKNNKNEFGVTKDERMVSESQTAVIWDIGLRLYLSTHLSLKLDILGAHYNAEFPNRSTVQNGTKGNDERFNNYDLSLGLVFAI